MANKTLKTLLGTLILGGLAFNSYGQDTIKTADGYTIKKDGYIIQDVRIGKDWKDIYEYDNGKLTKLITFKRGIKAQSYLYNKKGQLIREKIFDKDGKTKEVVNRKL